MNSNEINPAAEDSLGTNIGLKFISNSKVDAFSREIYLLLSEIERAHRWCRGFKPKRNLQERATSMKKKKGKSKGFVKK